MTVLKELSTVKDYVKENGQIQSLDYENKEKGNAKQCQQILSRRIL